MVFWHYDTHEIAHRAHLARCGHRTEFDAHSLDDAEAMLDEIERQGDELEAMVLPDDHAEALRERDEARAELERYEAAVGRLVAVMAEEPAVVAALFAGDVFERVAVVHLVVLALPMFEFIAQVVADVERRAREAERARERRERERDRLRATYARWTVARLSLAVAEQSAARYDVLVREGRSRDKGALASALALLVVPDPTP